MKKALSSGCTERSDYAGGNEESPNTPIQVQNRARSVNTS
jgi:hypothetical protein